MALLFKNRLGCVLPPLLVISLASSSFFSFVMYPDWPASAADLVPLPCCKGPKLKPFDFQGPQKIEFLDYIDEGVHAHVFKIQILGQIYALKLFRFVYDDDWLGPGDYVDPENLEAMSTLYNYSEPFSCECRAFGRIQEAGHDELAVRCFGYLLLDEEHERAMMNKFSHLNLRFNGNIWFPGREDLRSRFVGKDGRAPPIRGIVKEFGHGDQDLRTRDARRILRHVTQLQQLGIIQIDVAHRQIVSGKLCDFSTAKILRHPLRVRAVDARGRTIRRLRVRGPSNYYNHCISDLVEL